LIRRRWAVKNERGWAAERDGQEENGENETSARRIGGSKGADDYAVESVAVKWKPGNGAGRAGN